MVRFCFGRQEQSDDETYDDDQIHDDPSLGDARSFSYESLQLATNYFSRLMLIGKGGYANIYRGVLPDGTVIAVKRFLDERVKAEGMLRMVEVISRIRHPNIHQLMGYCTHKSDLLLVSEYVDNGSLYDLIHNDPGKEKGERRKHARMDRISKPTIVAICIGIARGLTHLHEDVTPRVVHLDIKPANVLLDRDFNPKITDFDLVSFLPATGTYGDTDPVLTTRTAAGTYGYIDPEYARSGRVTKKSDVYSFGVTLLEIITRRYVVSPFNDDENGSLVHWALTADFREERMTWFDYTDDLLRIIGVAFLCIKNGYEQPSMREVTQMLEGTSSNFGRQLLAPYCPDYFENWTELAISNRQFKTRRNRSSPHSERRGAGTASPVPVPAGSDPILEPDSGLGEIEPTDSDSESLAPPEIEEAGTSAAQSNAATVPQQVHVHQQLGVVVLSGTGDLVERLSQTMVFTRSTQLVFPEAVFPPFHTREFSHGGSRDLYTF